ncbi:MAG TPA: hypothetical protein VFB30_18750 [Spirochaetia bacterium]|nr:hypothetical protein [Spirochaetia bacterium]
MPAHYVYDDPDLTALNQGDVLEKAPEFVGLLRESHPHYADRAGYEYFMVLTQSCDLVRRGAAPCAAEYVNLAAILPVAEAIRREAARFQEGDWQRAESVISSRDRDKIVLFLQRLVATSLASNRG